MIQHQGVCRAPTENTPPLRCHTGNNGASSVQRRTGETNRKIKLSVYMAYGFRNIDNMIDMIMLRCSDIDVRLPWDYEAA